MMTLQEKIGQLILVGFDGTSPPSYLLEWLAEGRIGGVYLFARNVESPAQVKALVDSCHAAAKYPILVGIDQEGGTVARLRSGFTESPGAMALAAARDLQLAEDMAYAMGLEMAALGINWNFAPVADIAHNVANPSVDTRSAGRDKQLVSDIVLAQIKGFQRAGVAATVKHFPGLGNSVVDTHVALAKITGALEYLYDEDLIPFQIAIDHDVACVMTTHVMFEELDDRFPATLSATVVDGLLRELLGYQGAVCTDCMEMKAISDGWGSGESAVLSFLAGVDMLLFSHSRSKQEEAYSAMLHAARTGRLTSERIGQSLARIQAMKRRFGLQERPHLDIVACDAHQLLTGRAARAGTVLVQHGKSWPIDSEHKRVACVEFSSSVPNDTVEHGSITDFTRYCSQRLPDAALYVINADSDCSELLNALKDKIIDVETLILATRNAHLSPPQADVARLLIDQNHRTILVCLRNPYDAVVLSAAGTIICANGDSAPSLQAAVDAICGDYRPTGQWSINLE